MITTNGKDPDVEDPLTEHFPEKTRTVDPTQWDNIYVVGDVHGCSEEFLELIKKIDLKETELMVLVGDVTRKGPDTAGAVNIVRNRENIITVLGNGEVKYLNGELTLECLDEDHRTFIESWPMAITWPGNVVVHGGFDPNRDLSEHSLRDVVNMRSPENDDSYGTPFWFDNYEEEVRIFFGHTVTNEPIQQENTVALDTGCVYGGKLTAFDTNNETLHSVEAKRTYVPRSDDKYADTLRKRSAPEKSPE